MKGIPISSGKVAARVCLFSIQRSKLVPEYALKSDKAVQAELDRFNQSRIQCAEELSRIAAGVEQSIGKAESEIFTTQQHIMNDPKVVDAIALLITSKRRNAEWAINSVLSKFEELMGSLDDHYLRERSSDIGELKVRLLGKMTDQVAGFICRGQAHCRQGADRIVAAEELTTDMIVNMKIDKVLGFVTEHGGVTSHAAILARSLGVPAVSGVEGLMQHVGCGDMVLIDGDLGEIYINPAESTIRAAMESAPPVAGEPAVAVLPRGMEVCANASNIEDVKLARMVNADGIGLFRTEILFVGAERLLSEDEQYAYYQEAAKIMGGKIVTFRMLDVGGDKPLPFLRLRKEANPFLGWRGARFLLGNRDIFTSQIRAIGRVSLTKKVRILFPMVVDPRQIDTLLDRSRGALSGIRHDSANITFGAMFEVPSAFIQGREILKRIDFGSIGSNDLIQYLFAIDRNNEMLSQEYNPDHPALWIFLRELSAIAHELKKPLSICGEMAGREGMPKKLLDAKITSLSVAPRLIPRVRSEMVRFVRGPAAAGPASRPLRPGKKAS